MNVSYYFIPIVSALVGWITNYLTIKMLFLPRKEKRILFIKFQGVIPKRLPVLAEKLGTVISESLLTKDFLKKHLFNKELGGLDKIVKEKVDSAIIGMIEKNSIVKAFLNNSIINNISNTLTANITTAISESIENFGDEVISSINLKELISKQIQQQDPKMIQEKIWFILKTEFKFIEILGGVLGFIIGLLQLLFLYYESI